MKHLDLFSGIGGFALAARWVGWETVAFCEIEPYCQKVLAKHWPGIPIYDDIKEVTAERLRADGIECDILTGGFPCQDISVAGQGAGIEGSRSGLWSELARIIGEIRPAYAVMENVSALLGRGLDRVAGDLAEIGYDCEWHCIPASAVGAPHIRDRIWIIARPQHTDTTSSILGAEQKCKHQGTEDYTRICQDVSNAPYNRIRRGQQQQKGSKSSRNVADTDGKRGNRGSTEQGQNGRQIIERDDNVVDASESRLSQSEYKTILRAWRREQGRATSECSWWATEPNLGRVAHGVPARVDRLRGLGNAIVPQVAEVIFRAINGS